MVQMVPSVRTAAEAHRHLQSLAAWRWGASDMTADAIAPQRQAARDCRCRWASAAVRTDGTI